MNPPFDAVRLDALMEEAQIDVVLVTTKFNIQYLLGGYKFFFFANADAVGVSRYLPILAYVRGGRESSFYVGAGNEGWGTDTWDLWIPEIFNVAWTSVHAAEVAAEQLRSRGLDRVTIAVEISFIPTDAMDALRAQLPNARFVNAQRVLELLRAVKTPAELQLITAAAEKIVDSIMATFALVRPGLTKQDVAEVFRLEQTRRGLVFDYALVACGTDFNRAPSPRVWNQHETLSLDSGGSYDGWIGDLARMGIDGEPTALQVDVLAEIEHVQQAARRAVCKGNIGGQIFDSALAAMAQCDHRDSMSFVAHGMGLVNHEAPRLTSRGAIPYPAEHADKQLASGMVLSIETWSEHPVAGFIKLEDTLIVTDDSWEAPGDTRRGWNPCGLHA